MSCSVCSCSDALVYLSFVQSSHSLLRVDLEADSYLFAAVLNVFVHVCRAEPVFYAFVLRPLHLCVLFPILYLQVYWLVLLMIRSRSAHAREDIKAYLAIWLGILDLTALVRQLGRFRICARVLEGPRRLSAKQISF